MEPSVAASSPALQRRVVSGARWAGTLAALLVAGACRAASTPAIDERIDLRLGASYFDAAGTVRPATVDLRHEVREVVGRRQQQDLGVRIGVPFEAGAARLRFDLPEPLRAFPASAFRLGILKLPANADLEKIKVLAGVDESFTGVQGGAWSVQRDAADPGGATAVLPADGPDAAKQIVNMRVQVLEPTPRVLESAPFDVPAGSHLELGYALANGRGAAHGTRVAFTAAVHCTDGTRQDTAIGTLEVGAPEDGEWHDGSVPFKRAARQCRLRLAITCAASDAGDPVWATPRLVARVGKGEHVDPRSLVLISLDTLRADHLSSYGYARPTSPAIDRLMVAAGTAFTDVVTTYPSTDVAHLSALTGLYPGAQPVLGRLPRDAPARSLVETVRDAGFDTAAFTEDGYVSAAYGFAHGFDRLRERPTIAEKLARETFADGIRYIREHRRRRFFLFLHTYQVHSPYTPSAPYRTFFHDGPDDTGTVGRDVPALHRAEFDDYDRGIRETDDIVAGFLEELDRLGLGERTYVVLMSDHGEAFGEHVVLGHGFGAYQEELHVALVVRGPDIPRGRRVNMHASLVDVAPTLLELLGAPPLAQVEGVSLLPIILHPDGPPPPARPLFFEWALPGARGVRIGRWKLMQTATSLRFYDLESDPGERAPLVSAPEQGAAVEALAAYAASERRTRSGPQYERGLVPAQTQRALRALGYVQ